MRKIIRDDDLYKEIMKASYSVSALTLQSTQDHVRFCLQDACSILTRAAWLHYNRPISADVSNQ